MSSRVIDWMGDDVYLGTSKALVVDNKDPDKKGRIQVNSPVYGVTGFIPYIYPDDGFFSPPDIGSVVYIETDGGDEDYLIATGTVNDGNAPIDTRTEFQRLIPTNRGWATPGPLSAKGTKLDPNSGHLIELDDGLAMTSNGHVVQSSANKGMRFSTSGGSFFRIWEEESDGASKNRIELGTSDANLIQITDALDNLGQTITLSDKDGRTVEILKDSDNVQLRNGDSSKYINLKIGEDTIELESSIIKLGSGAVQPIILGTLWEAYNNAEIVAKLNMLIVAVTTLAAALPTHTHTYADDNGSSVVTKTTSAPTPTGGGAAGQIPAAAAVAGSSLLAQKAKAE